MTDYNHLRAICEKSNKLSKIVFDDFLMYFAAQNDKLEPEMNQRLTKFKHITQKFPQSWVNLIKAQYIAHRVFRKDGLIKKYLNHSALKHFTGVERNYLEHQELHPWRFSYSVIINIPSDDFFEMEDVFSGETFLLHSPGIADILKTQKSRLWFNLIAFNGACWQTYGPIGAYLSFEPDDIFFFATELNPNLESEEDIMLDIEKNHIPYSMLITGASFPVTVTKNDAIIQVMAEHDLDDFTTDGLESNFTIQYNQDVYKLGLKEWEGQPHFACAYYDEKRKILTLTAMTDRGFDALVKQLNALDFDLPEDADLRVTMAMLVTAGEIMKKKIRLNSYDSLFQIKADPKTQQEIDKINRLMAMILPDINAGKEPDLETLAKSVDLDIEVARQVIGAAIGRIKELKGKKF